MPDEQIPTSERHYSPKEVGDLWGLSPATVRRIFEDQPGVLKIAMPRLAPGLRKHKVHTLLRIPESVLHRLHDQWSGGYTPRKVQRGRRLI